VIAPVSIESTNRNARFGGRGLKQVERCPRDRSQRPPKRARIETTRWLKLPRSHRFGWRGLKRRLRCTLWLRSYYRNARFGGRGLKPGISRESDCIATPASAGED